MRRVFNVKPVDNATALSDGHCSAHPHVGRDMAIVILVQIEYSIKIGTRALGLFLNKKNVKRVQR
ncbi:hypothetical protein OUZ56_027787 [Daphnia magna]|uniref:Uncharacterized protein n=1 Tax=Daphnia magna TaxID=35525 RepID=A0ABR0B2J7_9CRUS|nr:hypothetical protein OUZ56_027787 [Daphnia magna]